MKIRTGFVSNSSSTSFVITNLTKGNLSVVKGVPYVHWRETITKNVNERNMRKTRIKPRPYMAVS